jgi:hypothetical protein
MLHLVHSLPAPALQHSARFGAGNTCPGMAARSLGRPKGLNGMDALNHLGMTNNLVRRGR